MTSKTAIIWHEECGIVISSVCVPHHFACTFYVADLSAKIWKMSVGSNCFRFRQILVMHFVRRGLPRAQCPYCSMTFFDAFSICRVHNLHSTNHFYWHIAGITGHVRIDDNGDRDADYSILDLDPITGRFEVVAHYYGLHRWVVFGDFFFGSNEVELTLASSKSKWIFASNEQKNPLAWWQTWTTARCASMWIPRQCTWMPSQRLR